jgi:hypothetical protein
MKLFACWEDHKQHRHRTKRERDACDNRAYHAMSNCFDELEKIISTKGMNDAWRERVILKALKMYDAELKQPLRV